MLESLLFWSRWLLAPFFVGLIVAILALLIRFCEELWTLGCLLLDATKCDESDVIVHVLTLVDTALIATLLLIIAFSGYENFVSRIRIDKYEDRPAWMKNVDFSDLKIKLMGVMVAISALDLLKSSSNDNSSNEQLAWKVGVHLTFVISGVLFAITDRIIGKKDGVE